MALQPLAEPADVTLLLSLLPPSNRPTPSDDTLEKLIVIASSRLRRRAPWIDEKIALFAADPTDPNGLDPTLVASVIAAIIKRALTNPNGAMSETSTETIGPYSETNTLMFESRRSPTGDDAPKGEITVLDSDIEALGDFSGPTRKIGTLRLQSTFGRVAY